MPNINDLESGVVKKELHVFYVLDTSGSMDGAPIASLNDAMRDTVSELADISKNSADAALKIAVMTYDSDSRWVTVGNNGVEDVEDFIWTPVQAGGLTYLGYALQELNVKLSRNEMMQSATGNKVPVIIFMSDGYPNDNIWEAELENLKKNKWYNAAIKIAFALGDDADTDVLAKVVGSSEAVIQTSNLEVFKTMIRVTSVTASLTASTSRTTNDAVTGADIIRNITDTDTNDGGPVIIDSIEDVDMDIYPSEPIADDFDSDWE